jgi:hypothetical protein
MTNRELWFPVRDIEGRDGESEVRELACESWKCKSWKCEICEATVIKSLECDESGAREFVGG